MEGTATLGFGKLIRVQESSEWGERLDLHKAHLHNVLHKLCSQKAAGLAGRGEAVTCLHAGGGSSSARGHGKTRDGTARASILPCSVSAIAHSTVAFPQAS